MAASLSRIDPSSSDSCGATRSLDGDRTLRNSDDVWLVKCAGQCAKHQIIATTPIERYRRYAYNYGLHAQMQSLQMQLGNYTTYVDFFQRFPASLNVYVPEWPYSGLQ